MNKWALILLLLLGESSRVIAGGYRDSLPSVRPDPASMRPTPDLESDSALLDIESGYHTTGDHRRAFARLLHILGSGTIPGTKRVRYRLFSDLAIVSARLRLYPIAMRCFYNASRTSVELPEDSLLYKALPLGKSVPVRIDTICAAFEDGRAAVAYAMLVEVQQPIPGKRRAFVHIGNVGHTFITLIKYNRDNSVVCRSFGFYPHKVNPLSATPLFPSAPSVIKDDSRHDWNEVVGRFISYPQFKKVLETLWRYNHKTYNLNHANCTDFGLTMARAGGISIRETSGGWPLGKGNNPGSAGQSMLEGKLDNADQGEDSLLFLADNIPGKP